MKTVRSAKRIKEVKKYAKPVANVRSLNRPFKA
jgi:hypothetical protein